jgi:hypothetical protein
MRTNAVRGAAVPEMALLDGRGGVRRRNGFNDPGAGGCSGVARAVRGNVVDSVGCAGILRSRARSGCRNIWPRNAILRRRRRGAVGASGKTLHVFGNSFPFSFHGTFLGTRRYWPLLTSVARFESDGGLFEIYQSSDGQTRYHSQKCLDAGPTNPHTTLHSPEDYVFSGKCPALTGRPRLRSGSHFT